MNLCRHPTFHFSICFFKKRFLSIWSLHSEFVGLFTNCYQALLCEEPPICSANLLFLGHFRYQCQDVSCLPLFSLLFSKLPPSLYSFFINHATLLLLFHPTLLHFPSRLPNIVCKFYKCILTRAISFIRLIRPNNFFYITYKYNIIYLIQISKYSTSVDSFSCLSFISILVLIKNKLVQPEQFLVIR